MSKYLPFFVVAMMTLLVAINSTSVSVAFPDLTASFNSSLILAGWVLSIYQLIGIIAMPLAGKASDILGGKVAFLIAVFCFVIGSLLCAVAPTIELVIVFRFIQGIGYGATLPIGIGIVADGYPESRQKFVGLLSSIFPIGQIIGPSLGGWMVSVYGWRSIFWFNVPLGIIIMIATIVLIKSGKRTKGAIDLQGAGWMTVGLLSLMIGLSFLGRHNDSGTSLPAAVALFGCSVVSMVFFVKHINRVEDPIIDKEILRGRPFLAANLFNFIYGAAVFGITSFLPLYVVSVYGMSILESGLIMTPRSFIITVTAAVTSFSLLRWGYRRPMVFGTLVIASSLALLGLELREFSFLGISVSSMTIIVAIMLFSGLGMGSVAPSSNNACIDLMPDKVAAITGVRGMFRTVGGTVSIAVISVLLDNISNIAFGFAICFFGTALFSLASLPLIFAMPSGPSSAMNREDNDRSNDGGERQRALSPPDQMFQK